jgi:Zn-dependent peptidase ImmA (M78 family)
MYHPWRQLRSLPSVDVIWSRDDVLLDGAQAWWYADRDMIVMDSRLKQVDRRCALAHELAHRERGDRPCGLDWFDARQEAAADLMAARWLISRDALLAALRWSDDRHEIADELWVTVDLLRVRLDGLHPSERHYLRRRLAEQEEEQSCVEG